MISKKEMDIFGSSEPFEWLKECFDILEREFKEVYNDTSDIVHIKTQSAEDVAKAIEHYKKTNPNKKISASGFVLISDK